MDDLEKFQDLIGILYEVGALDEEQTRAAVRRLRGLTGTVPGGVPLPKADPVSSGKENE